eukprot:5674440-Alexandrium_andersonii.AAC.1
MQHFVGMLNAFQGSALRMFAKSREVRATSHYSGVGMFEVAMSAVMGVGSDVPQVVVASAADISANCRKGLAMRTDAGKPLHIHGDICGRVQET